MKTKYAPLLVAVILVVTGVLWVPCAGAVEPGAALVVEVATDTDGSAELGRDCTYTITVRNSGSVDLSDIVVDDTFLGHVGAVGSLPVGESIDFTKTIIMRDPGAGICTVSARGPQGEEVVASAQHRVEIFIGDDFSDLAVSKRIVSGSAAPGATLRYRVVISNLSDGPVDADARSCAVIDDFDQNRTTVLDAGGATISSGRLLWTVDVPAPGASTVLEYTLRVRADAEGTIVNTVAVDYALDLAEDNNSATVRTPIVRAASSGGGSAGTGSGASSGTRGNAAAAEEPFLPFTGNEDSRAREVALAFLILGFALRVVARQERLA